MPIKIPEKLPTTIVFEKENIFYMNELRALKQDIRPLKIVILNLMPKKIETETQILRLLSNTPLQIDVELIQTATHTAKHTSKEHLLAFYKTFDDIKANKYDGMIITGAPVETMEFEEVSYWQELTQIMEWSKTNVSSCMHICWGAQVGLYYHYSIGKSPLPNKLFGVYEHKVLLPTHHLVRGFDELFFTPHSRHTSCNEEQIRDCDQLEILSQSEVSGSNIIVSKDRKNIFLTGHSEYDKDTLNNEYFRDIQRGLEIDVPVNYFKNDNPLEEVKFVWKAHAHMLFANWLNYFVYQQTPYDLHK